MSNLPLSGLTVISLERAVAAPFAARQVAEQGTRVIKIEWPGAGDFVRSYDQAVLGQSGNFLSLNCSKESLSLDLKRSNAVSSPKWMNMSPVLRPHCKRHARCWRVDVYPRPMRGHWH
jgi:crotonobetainyl-CoA:carnitine CoA-transferase CaiB-like acyl-CoA transferase